MDECDSEVPHFGNGVNISQAAALKPIWQFAIDTSASSASKVELLKDALNRSFGLPVLALPSVVVLVLVFPLRGEAGAGLRFHVVSPHVLGALAIGPDVFAFIRLECERGDLRCSMPSLQQTL